MKTLGSFTLILSLLSVGFAMDKTCMWVMNVLEMITHSGNAVEFRISSNTVRAESSYFVRLRISCKNQVNPFLARSLVHSGYTPVIRFEITGYGLEGVMNTTKVLYSEGALVQFQQSISTMANIEGNFLVMNTRNGIKSQMPLNCSDHIQNDNGIFLYGIEENILSPHCNETHLCDLAWLVPFTVHDSNVVVRCFLTNPHEIQSSSLTINSRGLSEPSQNGIGEIIDELPDGVILKQTIVVNNVALDIPFWIVDGFQNTDQGFYTDSEFERSSLIKIYNITQTAASKVCTNTCSSLEIKETLSLADRILLSTCFGVQEYREVAAGNSYVPKIVLRECIRRLIAPPQAYPGRIQILAIEDSSAKVFISNLSSGFDLEFAQLQDRNNRSLCEYLAADIAQAGDCVIHDVTMNSVPEVFYVFLASYSTDYYIVAYSNNEWHKHFSVPLSLPNITRGTHEHGEHWTLLQASTSGNLPVYLTGISFTRSTGSNLFVWGNVLFYSPNSGEDVLWLWDYDHNSNITVFTSAEDGSYAFLTDSQQVWWGHTGSAAVHYLETANVWNVGMMTSQNSCSRAFRILSLFYDVSGQLWKLISCQNEISNSTPCIFRSKVAIQDILSHSQLIHEQTSVVDDIINTPSILDYGPASTIPKHCLKYSVVYQAPHTSYHLQQIVDIIDVPYMVNTVPVSAKFLKDYLDNQRRSLSHPNTVEMSEMKDVLPQYVYLKRTDSYNFTVTMTLDSGLPNHGSVYWSSLDSLKLSYKVSDLKSLNVTAVRDVYSHKGTVQYRFILKDSDMTKRKTAPGINLRPVQIQVQPWQADETCFVTNKEHGILRGTQSMTVLLGCPPSMKIEFDPEASVNASGKNQFCDKKYGIPCFLYEHTFHPVFNIVDKSTGNTSRFTGKYHLRIIGGGKDVYSIGEYSTGDVELFNYQTHGSTSTLIWTPKSKNLGSIPSFNISDNGLQWLCGRKSPCSEIPPVFPHSPEFYFKLEFSNRDTDDESMNCDLTAQFVIRIHGLPLGSLYPATVIVATCMAFITAYVFTMYAFKRNNRKLLNLTRDFFHNKKHATETWIRQKIGKGKVEPTDNETSVQDCDTDGKKDV